MICSRVLPSNRFMDDISCCNRAIGLVASATNWGACAGAAAAANCGAGATASTCSDSCAGAATASTCSDSCAGAAAASTCSDSCAGAAAASTNSGACAGATTDSGASDMFVVRGSWFVVQPKSNNKRYNYIITYIISLKFILVVYFFKILFANNQMMRSGSGTILAF